MKKILTLSTLLDAIGMEKVENSPQPTQTDAGSSVKYCDKNGQLHNEYGPALIRPDGSTEWWWHGMRHRDEGPAREDASGTKEWYVNNKNHRVGGPAVIKSCGDTLWYLDGKLHRTDGPAVVMVNGSSKWYKNGVLHREDGPAVEHRSSIDGHMLRVWYWEGNRCSEEEVKWRLRDKQMRDNPPRMGQELKNLNSINGIPHDNKGPARVWNDGTVEWFDFGKRHRIDGPAVILPNGEEYYYLYNCLISKSDHAIRLKTNEIKPVEHINTTSTPSSNAEVPTITTAIVVAPKEELKVEEKIEEKVDEKDKNKVKQWPDEPDELALYADIFAPLKDILEKGYRLIRGNDWKFDYNGYEIGKNEKKIFPPAKEHFTEKFLRREKDKHGRTLFDVVMRLLFLMGIEQGRRMAYQEQAPVRTLQKTLADYRERNKSVRYQLAKANAIIKVREENPTLTADEVNKLIHVELEKTRQSRIEEIKAEMKMDPTLTCFKSKPKKKAKLTELLALANTLDVEIFKQPDWLNLLQEANCSLSDWKTFCKKNKFHKFI